jgi:hypothetical protein
MPASGLSVETSGTVVELGVGAAVVPGAVVGVGPVAGAVLVGAGAAVVVPLGVGVAVAWVGVVEAGAAEVEGAGRALRACSMTGCTADDASGVVSQGVTSPAPIAAAARPEAQSRLLPRSARCRPEVLGGAVEREGMCRK